jgi:hypothetical protein
MNRWAIGALVLIALAVAAFFGARMFLLPPAELDLSRSKSSANSLYVVSIQPEVEPVVTGAMHGWVVIVKDANGTPVTDAVITVDGGMPQHGHGMPTQVTGHFGEGHYRVEGMRFNMGGWWELTLTIETAAGGDTAIFNISL